MPSPDLDPTGFALVLRESLLMRGLVESDNPTNAELLLVFDHPRVFSKLRRALKGSPASKVLLRFEPKAVNPLLYRGITTSLYDKIVNVGGHEHIGLPNEVIRWPYHSHLNPARPTLDASRSFKALRASFSSHVNARDLFMSVIASNKVSWSKPSNYQLRRTLILRADRLKLSPFGMHWTASRLKRLQSNLRLFFFFISQGCLVNPLHVFENFWFPPRCEVKEVTDKNEILTRSIFNLVIENSSTYVSEKIIDALVSGAIPLYYGPDLERYGVPKGCYIPFSGSQSEIMSLVNSIENIDLSEIRAHMTEFMFKSNGLELWHPKKVADSIVKLIL